MRWMLVLAVVLSGCTRLPAGDPAAWYHGPRDATFPHGGGSVVELTPVHVDCLDGTLDYFTGSYAPEIAEIVLRGDGASVTVDPAKTTVVLVGLAEGQDLQLEVHFLGAESLEVGYGLTPVFRAAPGEVTKVTAFVYPVLDSVRMHGEAGCAQLSTARGGFSLAPLPDGRVLVAGGYQGAVETGSLTDEAELVDLLGGEVTTAAPMCPGGKQADCSPRAYGPAVTLPDGRVLIAGGFTSTDGLSDAAGALLYDPRSNTWTSAPMVHKRAGNTATQLFDAPSKVLIAGGASFLHDSAPPFLDSTEIFDAASNTFTEGARLDQPVALHGAARFTSRQAVGIAGGITLDHAGVPSESDLVMAFDPRAGTRVSGSGGPQPGGLPRPAVRPTVMRLGDELLIIGIGLGGSGEIPMHAPLQLWDGAAAPRVYDAPFPATAGACGVSLDRNRSWVGGGINKTPSPLDEMRFVTLDGGVPSVSPVLKPGDSVPQTLEDPRLEPGCIALDERRILVIGGWGSTDVAQPHALASIEVLTLPPPGVP